MGAMRGCHWARKVIATKENTICQRPVRSLSDISGSGVIVVYVPHMSQQLQAERMRVERQTLRSSGVSWCVLRGRA